MEKTVLVRQTEYRPEELERIFDGIFRELCVYDELKPGMTVVIKPNLIMRSRPEDAACTHPAVVAAVGKCVRKAGAEVLIAESPGGPYTPGGMKSHFRGCGYTEMAEANGFSLYTECKSREVALPRGTVCRQVTVVEPFLDADFIIDIAKLKTHSMVGFSGAVKNMFGVVPGLQKPELHCRFPDKEDFSRMLVDIADFTRPGLAVVDGIWAMEGNGPTGGKRRQADLLAASRNPWAVDVCAASVAGIDPDSILHLRYGAERGLGPGSLREVEILGETVESMRIPDFLRAKASGTDFLERLPGFLRPLAKRIATPRPRIDGKNCVGCGKCAESCPQHTIQIREGKAEIDYKNCIHCFCCHEMCPKHVIDIRRWGILKL